MKLKKSAKRLCRLYGEFPNLSKKERLQLEIWGSQSGADEDSRLAGYNTV
jgi:hypothetical protein